MAATPHSGHRKRMRERYLQNGLDGFAAHEVIELLLFYCRARGDVNATAHELMEVFGSLGGVFEASPEQLMSVSGIGEESATLLSMILPLFRRYSQEKNDMRHKLQSWQDIMHYCHDLLIGYNQERLYVVCLDASGVVINHRLISRGTIAMTAIEPRQIVDAALTSNTYSVVLCHNHPGGQAEPSLQDICATRYIQQLLEGLGIIMIDHVIVADKGTYSMGQHGNLLSSEESTKAMRMAAGLLRP